MSVFPDPEIPVTIPAPPGFVRECPSCGAEMEFDRQDVGGTEVILAHCFRCRLALFPLEEGKPEIKGGLDRFGSVL